MKYLTLIVLFSYFVITLRAALQMYQQNIYDRERFMKWLKNNKSALINKTNIILYIFIFLKLILNLGDYDNSFYSIMLIIFTIILLINEFLKKENSKLPLNYTNRLKRLYAMSIIIFILVSLFSFINNFSSIILLLIIIIFKHYFLVLINFINMPIENFYKNKFKNEAKNKLSSIKNIKVIGITGSYGKTSSKDILSTILSEHYNVLKTPNSYNTPMGLTITINKYLKNSDEIFIAEMGAYKKGEIKELCDLVKPQIGIITSLGPQHLESFKTIDNIIAGKFELIESLPKNGVGIINNDDLLQINYKIKNNCRIITYGLDTSSDVRCEDITYSNTGTTFKVLYNGESETINIPLLGKHNIHNTLAAIAVGIALNNSLKELCEGIKYIKPSQHRLELKQGNGYTIIDDAFNSNPIGSKNALEVLSKFQGYKIVMTPGMIELGSKQEELNEQFGEYMNKYVDLAILIGKEQTKPILKGINKNKKIEVVIFNDVLEGFKYVEKLHHKNKILLIENDLPDSYKEK